MTKVLKMSLELFHYEVFIFFNLLRATPTELSFAQVSKNLTFNGNKWHMGIPPTVTVKPRGFEVSIGMPFLAYKKRSLQIIFLK